MTNSPKKIKQKPEDRSNLSEEITISYGSVYVGVDAGGTKIEVTLTNNNKEVLHSSKVDLPANPAKIRKSQAIENLVSAIGKTFETAIHSMRSIKSIVVGLAGVDDEDSRKSVEEQLLTALLPLTNSEIRIEVLTDSEVSLLTVSENLKALVIIAGTGAIIKGKNK